MVQPSQASCLCCGLPVSASTLIVLETTSLARIMGLLLLSVKACSVTRNHCWQHEDWRHLGISHRIARPPQSLDHSSEQKQKGPASSAYALVSK